MSLVYALLIAGLIMAAAGMSNLLDAQKGRPAKGSIRDTVPYAGFQLVLAAVTITSYSYIGATMLKNPLDPALTFGAYGVIGATFFIPVVVTLANHGSRLIAAASPYIRALKPGTVNPFPSTPTYGAAATA